MKSFQIHLAAAEEVREAIAYFFEIDPDLAAKFQVQLAATLERIRGNPEMYAAEDGETRIAPLHRFQYAVIYESLADSIWIAAVAHHSRRPGYWKNRHSR